VLVLVLLVLLQVPEVGVLQHGPWFGIKEDVKIKVKFIIQEKTETEVFKLSLIVKFLGYGKNYGQQFVATKWGG